MLIDEKIDDLQNLTNSKISLSQIGEILGVSRAAISKRAKLGSDIGVSELRKIEQFYKVELLERDDQINNQVKIDLHLHICNFFVI